jgi:hypothetical protein
MFYEQPHKLYFSNTYMCVCEYIKNNEAGGKPILYMKIKNLYRISVENLKERDHLRTVMNRQKANIKMILDIKHATVWTKLKWLRNGSNGAFS